MIILEKKLTFESVIYENDEKKTVPSSMTELCSEGDVIFLSGDIYLTDTEATQKRRRDIIALQNSLFK